MSLEVQPGEEKAFCASCNQRKATTACGLCQASLCRKCVQFVDPETLRYFDVKPADLMHGNYCGPCFVTKVSPVLAEYEEVVDRARVVVVFMKKKGEETRLLNRSAKPIRVEDCFDEEETLLRLAYLAARDKFNVLLDVEVTSKIVRHDGGYQTSRFRGTAIPSLVDPQWLKRTEDR